MTQPNDKGRGIIGFAEKLLALLDEGRFTATYKYAVLIGLMDLCMENSLDSGLAPESVTTRQLAEKIIEIYWPHVFLQSGFRAFSFDPKPQRASRNPLLHCSVSSQAFPRPVDTTCPGEDWSPPCFRALSTIRRVEAH
jgi:hypothetical protein